MGRPRNVTPKAFSPKTVLPELVQQGAEEYKQVRGKIPDTLTEVVLQQLKPQVRTAIAKRLIDIAINGRDRDSLDAMKHIWERLEGRSRQADPADKDQSEVLLGILDKVFKDDRRLHASTTTAEFKVLPPDDISSATREGDL